MSMIHVWLSLAMVLTIGAYGVYWWGIRRQLVRPNRSSWLIWSAITTVEALTYQAVNEGLIQNIVFFMNAASCLFITFVIWRQSAWQRPSNAELICMAISIAAMIVWLGFNDSFWAHILVVAAVPISFVPTWLSANEDRRREWSPAWGLWSIADFSTLMVILLNGAHGMDLPYIVVELVCHAAVWTIIGFRSINPWGSPSGASRHGGSIDDAPQTDGKFQTVESALGKSVLAMRAFAVGSILMEFSGPRYHRSEVFIHRPGTDDRFMQIGPDDYMGPSGSLDDLVNHSCEPNAGLSFRDDGIFLVAIRPIQGGEELCWDYSTTSSSSSFFMRCQCKTPSCRGIIGDFEFLEPELQERYRDRGLVPPYLRSAPSLSDQILAA